MSFGTGCSGHLIEVTWNGMKSLQGSTVAVTGGCGFIGSHLIETLRRGGVRVLAIDSLEYGRRENLDLSDPDIRIEKLELRSGTYGRLQELLQGVDFVFHLAAEKHNQSVNSPCRVLDANVLGTYELLKAAADVGVRKVVFTSSLYAYGRMGKPPMSEDETPVPHTVYGISKLSGEHLCRHIHMQAGMPIVCLRLFFVYGPRQYAGLGYKSVIVRNFDRMLAGERPVINGDGNQELDYIYVDDVVSALMLAMMSEDAFEVLNVGNGSAVSINHLTKLMMEIAGARTECDYGPADFTAGSSRVANTAKFERCFGPQTRVSLFDGLQRTFRWMESARRGNR
jgi:UDP-glucose 4-epimerase